MKKILFFIAALMMLNTSFNTPHLAIVQLVEDAVPFGAVENMDAFPLQYAAEEDIAVGVATPTKAPQPSATPPASVVGTEELTKEQLFAQELVALTNKARTARGISALEEADENLLSAVFVRVVELAKNFSHRRPNDSPWYSALDENEVDYLMAAENIISGQKTAEAVISAWMNSVGHKTNILNPNYSKLAIAVYIESSTVYCVQIFIGDKPVKD